VTAPPFDPDAFRRFEREAHDRVAPGYADFFAPVTRLVIEALLDAAGVRAGSRVLDVAAGPGDVAARAAARGARVAGVDLSPEMVALARRLHPAVAFREGDAEALPFPDGSFEAVVCNFGVGHFPRAERAAAELARVTAPGGAVALSWWDVPERARINGVFFEAVASVGAPPPAAVPPGPPPFRFASDGELAALLGGSGLQDVRLLPVTGVHRVASVEAWWRGGLGSLARASAAVLGQPPETQARIRAAFDRIAGRYARAGGVDVPVAAKVAAGWKPGA
jgi:SAM-dependent methyltransferase